MVISRPRLRNIIKSIVSSLFISVSAILYNVSTRYNCWKIVEYLLLSTFRPPGLFQDKLRKYFYFLLLLFFCKYNHVECWSKQLMKCFSNSSKFSSYTAYETLGNRFHIYVKELLIIHHRKKDERERMAMKQKHKKSSTTADFERLVSSASALGKKKTSCMKKFYVSVVIFWIMGGNFVTRQNPQDDKKKPCLNNAVSRWFQGCWICNKPW